MLNSEKAAEIISTQKPMDKSVINRVKKTLASKGVKIEQSAELDKYLILAGKEAVVYSDNTIVMHTGVSASGFFEELIHYGQLKSGRAVYGDNINTVLLEIEAQERLIKYKKAYKITDEEIAILKSNLNEYKILLEKLQGEGE